MFALINYARFVDVNPDEALERTNRRFIARFQHLETAVREDGKDLSDMTLKEMDVYWESRQRSAQSLTDASLIPRVLGPLPQRTPPTSCIAIRWGAGRQGRRALACPDVVVRWA